MAAFQSHQSYTDFVRTVSHEWRFTRSSEQQQFLDTVIQTSLRREETLRIGAILYRAQIGFEEYVAPGGDDEVDRRPYPPERMKPLQSEASEGRANPKGIPYLYLATEHETAVAEVRPWVGASVSVAAFAMTQPVRIVNCADERSSLVIYLTEPNPDAREKAVWRDINNAFARPVTINDRLPDYVPTQILAESFRHAGFDGLAFKSSLGRGINVVLFDVKNVRMVSCELVTVDGVQFSTSTETGYTMMTPNELLTLSHA